MNKERKHYRYKKITPNLVLEKMKELRANGMTHKKIAEKLKLGESTVGYWLNPETRKKTIERAKRSYARLTPAQRRKKEKERYEYKKEYFLERYNNDEEFRERMIKYVQKSFKKRRKKWISEGNCSKCGKKRKDKEYKLCEKCREKGRRK